MFRMRFKYILTTFVYCVSISFTMAYTYLYLAQPSGRAGTKQIEETIQDRSLLDLKLSSFEYHYERAVVESVLSIIKTYYVDRTRITNSNLFKNTMKSVLHAYGGKLSVVGDNLSYSIGGKDFLFYVNRQMSYSNLVQNLVELGRILGDHSQDDFNSTSKRARHNKRPGINKALASMLSSLDAHSNLLTQHEYQDLKQGTEGKFGGLGVLVGMKNQLLTVIKPLPKSPAERFGIHQMDRILSIDGIDTFGYSLGDLVEFMRGEPGSDVNLSLLRKGALMKQQVKIKREIIEVDSVVSKLIKTQEALVQYIQIESFSTSTSQEVQDVFNELESKFGVGVPVVLDLRSNPGGLLDQAIKVADLFIDKGLIVKTKGRNVEKEFATPNLGAVKYPLVVLIDENSASASEIVAGALQDHNRAIILGQPSFGKGSVQTIFELPRDEALKLTIARYYTPSGRSIQNVGIIPDVWVQPVTDYEQNLNLLGYYRYRNERFLLNHLIEPIHTRADASGGNISYKGFYMKSHLESAEDRFPPKNDFELNLATDIIKEIKKTYPNTIPSPNARSGHWLSLSSLVINRRLAAGNKKVNRYFRKNHKLDWSLSSSMQKPKLTLNASIDNHKGVYLGSKLKFRYRIGNQDLDPATQISLYIRPEKGIDTSEILIGMIKPGSTARGVASIDIPASWEPGPMKFEIGLAKSGYPLAANVNVLNTKILKRDLPKINVKMSFEESKEGNEVSGVLETNEKAKIKVALSNISDSLAHKVRVSLVNLTGEQLKLDEGVEEIPELIRGRDKTIMFQMQGGNKIIENKMTLGVLVESYDLKTPFSKTFAFSAQPSTD